MNPDELKGKRIIEIIIVVLMLIYLGLLTVSYLSVKSIKIQALVNIVFMLGVFYYLHKGNQWARYITTFFLIIGVLGCGFGVILTLSFSSSTLLMILFALIFGMMADQLLLSKSVKAYFVWHNAKVDDNKMV